jgi:hypothetical protein
MLQDKWDDAASLAKDLTPHSADEIAIAIEKVDAQV